MSFADGILTARTFAGKREPAHPREPGAPGVLGDERRGRDLAGLPLGASGSRTAVNDQMGARTQVAGLVAAGAIALVLLFLTTPMSYLPSAVLGAVIVSAAIGLVDPERLARAGGRQPVRGRAAAATTVGVVALGVLKALVDRRRAVDRRRRPAQRAAARRRARLGRPARSLRERRAPSVGACDPRRRRLPAGRPPLLRERPLCQGTGARGGSWSAGACSLARLRRRKPDPCRLHRDGSARSTSRPS